MCLKPVFIMSKYIDDDKRFFKIPCGKCEECLKRRQNDFMIRGYSELLFNQAHFFTFTYSPANLPVVLDKDSGSVVPSLSRRDFHKLLDNLRHYCSRHGYDMPRYFICGEYGEHTFRPHGHGLFLNLSSELRDFIYNYWKDTFGFCSCQLVGKGIKDISCSSRYVSKYTAKSVFTVNSDSRFDSLMVKPFNLHSRGWGDNLLERLEPIFTSCISGNSFDYDLFVQSLNVTIGNVRYKLPNYYFKRLLSKVLQTEEYRNLFSFTSYKEALERQSNIYSLQSEFGLSYSEAFKLYNSEVVYCIPQKESEDIEVENNSLRAKRLRSYVKDSF